jgi:hypothetical protein
MIPRTMKLPLIALSLVAAPLFAGAADLQFTPLFNGKDLTGWVGGGYNVKDGALVPGEKAKVLHTEKRYANYVLEFDFKLPPGGNNGIGIHYPGQGDAAYVAMEIQVLDDSAKCYEKLKPSQYHGSIYKLVAAKRGALKPVGEWNHERITVDGPSVKVELNGKVITEGNLDELQKKHPGHQGVKRRSGFIALCGHHSEVAFRNLRIAELPPSADAKAAAAKGYKPLLDPSLGQWKLTGKAAGHWKMVNGILHHDGQGGELWTKKPYKDLEMVFDWRWPAPGPKQKRPVILPDGTNKKGPGGSVEVEELDSGVYLRGNSKSQVNLWNWPVGSGEVYGYRTARNTPPDVRAAVTPKSKADKPLGEWNRMKIVMKGDRLSVTLNGKLVIDKARLPGVPASGPLALQCHHAPIDFANIWVKEL